MIALGTLNPGDQKTVTVEGTVGTGTSGPLQAIATVTATDTPPITQAAKATLGRDAGLTLTAVPATLTATAGAEVILTWTAARTGTSPIGEAVLHLEADPRIDITRASIDAHNTPVYLDNGHWAINLGFLTGQSSTVTLTAILAAGPYPIL
jgi:hypothetical protein